MELVAVSQCNPEKPTRLFAALVAMITILEEENAAIEWEIRISVQS
jgi:hypothetical protein